MSKREDHADSETPETSKSQLKREARELFDLGKELSEMPPSVVATLPLDDTVRTAIADVRAIRSRVAHKRQLGFLAGLLRARDMEPVHAALAARHREAGQLTARQHRCEAWRDRLIQDGDTALAELLEQRREIDVQALRQLARNARQEAERNQPPATARKLFRLLREIDQLSPLPTP